MTLPFDNNNTQQMTLPFDNNNTQQMTLPFDFLCKRARFSIHKALLSIHRALWSIHRALLSIHRALWSIRRALLSIHGALSSIHRAILSIRSARVSINRASIGLFCQITGLFWKWIGQLTLPSLLTFYVFRHFSSLLCKRARFSIHKAIVLID